MNHNETKAYARGYNSGRARAWPAHKPPSPPEPIVRQLMDALRDLRDEVDAVCATFGEDDEVVKQFSPRIDAADAALASVTRWLTDEAALAAQDGGAG